MINWNDLIQCIKSYLYPSKYIPLCSFVLIATTILIIFVIKDWTFSIPNFYIELGKKIMFTIISIVYIFALMHILKKRNKVKGYTIVLVI